MTMCPLLRTAALLVMFAEAGASGPPVDVSAHRVEEELDEQCAVSLLQLGFAHERGDATPGDGKSLMGGDLLNSEGPVGEASPVKASPVKAVIHATAQSRNEGKATTGTSKSSDLVKGSPWGRKAGSWKGEHKAKASPVKAAIHAHGNIATAQSRNEGKARAGVSKSYPVKGSGSPVKAAIRAHEHVATAQSRNEGKAKAGVSKSYLVKGSPVKAAIHAHEHVATAQSRNKRQATAGASTSADPVKGSPWGRKAGSWKGEELKAKVSGKETDAAKKTGVSALQVPASKETLGSEKGGNNLLAKSSASAENASTIEPASFLVDDLPYDEWGPGKDNALEELSYSAEYPTAAREAGA